MEDYNNILLIVGVETEIDADFKFKGKMFQYLPNNPLDFNQICSVIRRANRDFVFKIVEGKLVLVFDENMGSSVNYESRIHLLRLIFTDIESIPLKSNQLSSIRKIKRENSKFVTTKLYDMLNVQLTLEKYESNALKVIKTHFSLKFQQYQIRSVLWLVDREKSTAYLPQNYYPITCKLSGQTFYVNPRNLEIQCFKPPAFPIPKGGILADEMGLGKTIEMLALIMTNKRFDITNYMLSTNTDQEEIDDPPTKRKKLCMTPSNIFCICVNNLDDTNIIQCVQCKFYQHSKCVRKYTKNENQIYKCPMCWSSITSPIKSGTTIIVTPHQIKNQWFTEIMTHVRKDLKVFLYDGVPAGWISPIELSEYDIILTDYNILKREIDFSAANESKIKLRTSKKCYRTNSPLFLVEWWRVCLDEAQMVGSITVKAAQMVKQLHTVHRWAVTGTPISKSIDDLYGLIDYLDIRPLCEKNMWKSLVNDFISGETNDLVDILKKIMWRTSKSLVVKELNIPQLKEEVHFIEMSDAQKFFYQDQHANKAILFEERLAKMFSTSDTKLSQIDPRKLNIILEPLKKLRQDCTIPILTKRNLNNYKKLLAPKELITHLLASNEWNCKNFLRSLASNYNALAGIEFIRKDYDKCVENYKHVLKLAEENNGNVCVDSLQQIHALHNIIEALQIIENGETVDVKLFTQRLHLLKNKYLAPYATNLKNAEAEYKSFEDQIDKLINVCHASNLPLIWLKFYQHANDFEIYTELRNRISEDWQLIESCSSFSSFAGALFFVETWLMYLLELRENLQKSFNELRKLVDNVKSEDQLSKSQAKFIKSLYKECFDCHLIKDRCGLNITVTNTPTHTNTRTENGTCRLCCAKNILDRYECRLFQKSIDETTNLVEGTWKPSCHEEVMKMIVLSVRKRYPALYEKTANKPLELVNVLKNEFKELTKLWIELDYTIKAYDELDMCIMRLKTVSMSEGFSFTCWEINENEIDSKYAIYNSDTQMLKGNFCRAKARLNYVKRLDVNENPGPCPVCQQDITFKYSVWECGHHLCCSCLVSMVGLQWSDRFLLTCPICRYEQKYSDIYTVHLDMKSVETSQVRGDFSGKVEEIVRTVLKLIKDDKSVKILVFSHWECILGVIAKAFSINEITHRAKWSTKSLEEFKNKSLDITCMLLLLSNGAKGLNLTEATHLFFVEPLLNPGEESQAIGRIHRMGQTKPTTVHRFIVKNTIEEKIHNGITSKDTKWDWNELTFEKIKSLFSLPSE